METKYISPHQYAKLMGCHVSYVHRLLLNGTWDKLEFIQGVKRYSRFYTLEVPKNLTADSFKKIIVTKLANNKITTNENAVLA